MTSLLVIFRAFLFFFFIPRPSIWNLFPVNQLIKKILAFAKTYLSEYVWYIRQFSDLLGEKKKKEKTSLLSHIFHLINLVCFMSPNGNKIVLIHLLKSVDLINSQ